MQKTKKNEKKLLVFSGYYYSIHCFVDMYFRFNPYFSFVCLFVFVLVSFVCNQSPDNPTPYATTMLLGTSSGDSCTKRSESKSSETSSSHSDPNNVFNGQNKSLAQHPYPFYPPGKVSFSFCIFFYYNILSKGIFYFFYA